VEHAAAAAGGGGGSGGGGGAEVHDYTEEEGSSEEGENEVDGQAGGAPPSGPRGFAARVTSWLGGRSKAKKVASSTSNVGSAGTPAGATSERHQRAQKAAQKLRDEHTAANTELQRLRDRKATLEKLLSADAGPDGAFLSLVGQCFTANVDHYTYRVCPFDAATQDPGSTSLGSWAGFVPDSNYGAATFTGGAQCWNGPQRSLRLDLQCGPDNLVTKVEEPNRCEYRADFHTPAACSPDLVAKSSAAAAEALALVEAVNKANAAAAKGAVKGKGEL
jgi:hypothetical protein